jgi:putative FmdB family regulatory protein
VPTYTYVCEFCGNGHEEYRKIDDRDNETVCPCGCVMTRPVEAPAVMNVAMADGTRRFDNVRRYRELERAKKYADKVDKAKLTAEQGKIFKGVA